VFWYVGGHGGAGSTFGHLAGSWSAVCRSRGRCRGSGVRRLLLPGRLTVLAQRCLRSGVRSSIESSFVTSGQSVETGGVCCVGGGAKAHDGCSISRGVAGGVYAAPFEETNPSLCLPRPESARHNAACNISTCTRAASPPGAPCRPGRDGRRLLGGRNGAPVNAGHCGRRGGLDRLGEWP